MDLDRKARLGEQLSGYGRGQPQRRIGRHSGRSVHLDPVPAADPQQRLTEIRLVAGVAAVGRQMLQIRQ